MVFALSSLFWLLKQCRFPIKKGNNELSRAKGQVLNVRLKTHDSSAHPRAVTRTSLFRKASPMWIPGSLSPPGTERAMGIDVLARLRQQVWKHESACRMPGGPDRASGDDEEKTVQVASWP